MAIQRKTGIILSFESGTKGEIHNAVKRFSNSIDAILLKEHVLLRGSVSVIKEVKDFIRKNNFDKPIIIDYRLEQSEIDSVRELSSLFKKEGAYGMTIMAIYDEDFIKSCKKQAEIGIFAIIDLGTKYFRDHFDDSFVIQNSVFARNHECEGIVMTSRHLDRIKKIRKAVGKDFQLISTLENGDKLGDSKSAGADFEVVPHSFFKRIIVSKL